MKYLICALLTALVFALPACTSPAQTVSNHFKALTQIAKGHPDDCDAMGKALNDYLAQNKDSFSRAVSKTASSTHDESRELYQSSYELHEVTRNCQNESVELFRASLAEITLKAANVKRDKTPADASN